MTFGVEYFSPSIHSIKMENFLQFRERKISMVNIHEIEAIVEVLYRGIGVRRVGNGMVRGPMLSLNGCHCAETIEMMVTKVKKEKRMRRATTDVWLPYIKRNGTRG